jgi:hypothetical protein
MSWYVFKRTEDSPMVCSVLSYLLYVSLVLRFRFDAHT